MDLNNKMAAVLKESLMLEIGWVLGIVVVNQP